MQDPKMLRHHFAHAIAREAAVRVDRDHYVRGDHDAILPTSLAVPPRHVGACANDVAGRRERRKQGALSNLSGQDQPALGFRAQIDGQLVPGRTELQRGVRDAEA